MAVSRHTHATCNAVTLVWGSLRLAPITLLETDQIIICHCMWRLEFDIRYTCTCYYSWRVVIFNSCQHFQKQCEHFYKLQPSIYAIFGDLHAHQFKQVKIIL